jgi:FkbM family methyltransferase
MEKYINVATTKTPNGVIVDIGGHIGLNALMFSDYAPVHTFEPMFFNVLNTNITNAKTKFPIITYDIGLSHTKCTRDIYTPDKGSQNTINYGNCSLTKPNTFSACKTIYLNTLDSCVINDPIVFIKIDVEGHEYEVLNGASKTIHKHKPMLCVEIWDITTSQIPKLLADTFGYSNMTKEADANYIFL